jgi:hypothetical protein
MSVTLPASITGGAQTGFTTPGYTTTVDTPTDVNAKQVAVTAITGTQAGVDAHSVARPFTVAIARPKQFQVLGKPNPTTGLIGVVPRNTYKLLTRKGVLPLAAQPSAVAIMRTEIEIPAGADIADASNLRAMISAHIGVLNSISAGLGDTTINGVL